MKKRSPVFYHIFIFVLAQVAWFSLLGLWIYWYVTNYILLTKVGQEISARMVSGSTNVFALISGLFLLVVVSVGMSLIFIYLNKQLHLTKMYDNFIANVTHELKSPLSSIQLYLETMGARDVPQNKQREFFRLMLKDVDRLNNLINSILYMSGFEQKKTALKYPHNYHIYNANSILREIIDEAAEQQKIPPQSIRIEGSLSCRCVIDRNWFRIVFDNLFDNARKYSVNPVQINVFLSCTPKQINIEVQDFGMGIAPRDQKKVFHKFQRIDTAESPNVKGTGLGLYWVKEIINYHGGKITVSSKGKGHGSTFKIELPVYKVSKKRHIRNLLKHSINKTDTKT